MCCRAIKTKVIEGAVIAYQSLLFDNCTDSSHHRLLQRRSIVQIFFVENMYLMACLDGCVYAELVNFPNDHVRFTLNS